MSEADIFGLSCPRCRCIYVSSCPAYVVGMEGVEQQKGQGGVAKEGGETKKADTDNPLKGEFTVRYENNNMTVCVIFTKFAAN